MSGRLNRLVKSQLKEQQWMTYGSGFRDFVEVVHGRNAMPYFKTSAEKKIHVWTLRSWICFRRFCTLYHGKSPFNHPTMWICSYIFPSILRKIKVQFIDLSFLCPRISFCEFPQFTFCAWLLSKIVGSGVSQSWEGSLMEVYLTLPLQCPGGKTHVHSMGGGEFLSTPRPWASIVIFSADEQGGDSNHRNETLRRWARIPIGYIYNHIPPYTTWVVVSNVLF